MNMEYCFRTAIWMFLLLGTLQAGPIRGKINEKDLGFLLLTEEVSCEKNVTFVSPTNIPTNCQASALQTIKDGLFNATQQCKDDSGRIGQILETLENIQFELNPSNCTWEDKKYQKPFEEFVKDLKSFVQLLNSAVEPSRSP